MSYVLIVDDDPSIRELLSMYLRKEQYEVETAADGEGAMATVARRTPDLVLLDIMMPGMDGYEVCRQIRAQGDIPIIFITARDDDIEPIIGLEMGADDYITKPFNTREVVARVRAVLRRNRPGKPATEKRSPIALPQFNINPETREVHVDGNPVSLTPREFDIIHLLASSPRTVFSRQDIMTNVWGYDADYGDYRTVDTHLKRARQKLKDAGLTEVVIETVWGIGYRMIVAGDTGQ